MSFLITLVCTGLVAGLLNKPIKRFPMLFYALALALTAFYLYAFLYGASVFFWRYVLLPFQRCTIALALFTLVMFVGVLSDTSRLRALFYPLRRELSILGSIFACGHIVAYMTVFLPKVFGGLGQLNPNLTFSLAVSCLLVILLALLTVTSFVAIRKRMSPQSWKRVQLLAYPFFLLIYVHLIVVLLPSALSGAETIAINLVVYTLLFVLYTVLRLRKALSHRRQANSPELSTGH
ncbi:MAG: ferric reductase-like transmembrane domain-containing protein [Coriobacteriales bacterium]|jgi:DMSO/TMAO reductase YedYZ heme-binding membrane subunit|nr:ferric reductase-like transmembrane domain-containing protein [Coriobacteriales bacterium]